MNYFAHLPTLNVEPYTDYFLNKLVPSKSELPNFDFDLKKLIYIPYLKKDLVDDPVVTELDNLLQTKYNFPPIFYFSIFRHTVHQEIHVDYTGTQRDPRYASLNLPLTNYDSTKMIFYKPITDTPPRVGDAYFYTADQVEPVAELKGSNDWVLVNSGVPHQIVTQDLDNPRITLCIRFEGNPTFDDCYNLVRGAGIEPVWTA